MDKRNKIVALLIVKDIPFLFYNEDTLLKINVVFTYIWTEYKKRASLDRIERVSTSSTYENHERQDIVDFKLEVLRLKNLLNGFAIDSRIYAIFTKNETVSGEISEILYLSEELSILDRYISLHCGEKFVHLILFPFISLPSIYQKSKNLEVELREIETTSRVEELEASIHKTLSKKESNQLTTKHISVKNFDSLLEEYSCV